MVILQLKTCKVQKVSDESLYINKKEPKGSS